MISAISRRSPFFFATLVRVQPKASSTTASCASTSCLPQPELLLNNSVLDRMLCGRYTCCVIKSLSTTALLFMLLKFRIERTTYVNLVTTMQRTSRWATARPGCVIYEQSGCQRSNAPVPESTTRPMTRRADGVTMRSCSPRISACVKNFVVVSKDIRK